MKLRLLAGLLAIGIATALAGCSGNAGLKNGTVHLRMTDSPAAIDQVNIVVTEVSIHRASISEESLDGWEVLRSETATFDVLTLRNGVFVTLALGQVPAGRYNQIRLKIGEGSNIVVDGVTHSLVIPSGMQTGLKLTGEFTVPEDGTLDLVLDFDAQRSIVLTGAGQHMLKPVVRILRSEVAGAIKGSIPPECTPAVVFAISGQDTLGSSAAEADGDFTISVLTAGTFSLIIDAAEACRDTTLTGVVVAVGSTTDVGRIGLIHQ